MLPRSACNPLPIVCLCAPKNIPIFSVMFVIWCQVTHKNFLQWNSLKTLIVNFIRTGREEEKRPGSGSNDRAVFVEQRLTNVSHVFLNSLS